MDAFKGLDVDWLSFGIVMVLVLIYAVLVALLTRVLRRNAPDGQTFWLVGLGVGGVLAISGLVVGFVTVGILLLVFAVAAFPMGIEYYQRIIAQERKARQAAEEMLDGHARADRKK